VSLFAVVLGLATATAQGASRCGNPTVDEVRQLSAAARLEITSCFQRVTADQINALQAGRNDPHMTMKADVEGATLRYNYRLALDAKQIPEARRAAILSMLKGDLCADGQAKIVMSNGGSYRYIFKDRSGQIIRDVVIDHC